LILFFAKKQNQFAPSKKIIVYILIDVLCTYIIERSGISPVNN